MRKLEYYKKFYHIRSKNLNIIKSSDIENNKFESIEEAQKYINNIEDENIRNILEVDLLAYSDISS